MRCKLFGFHSFSLCAVRRAVSTVHISHSLRRSTEFSTNQAATGFDIKFGQKVHEINTKIYFFNVSSDTL